MRVISGVAKGHHLTAPRGLKTRPTTDRVKEGLFNIISARVDGAAVLDIFAGTGSLGIEALSRGAASAIFVDSDKAAINAIRRNLASTKLTEKAVVMQSLARRALDKFTAAKQAFDLIFLDPPYKIDRVELGVVLERAAGCLGKSALLVLEHRFDLRDSDIRSKIDTALLLVDSRRYGDTALSFYIRCEPGATSGESSE
jgi:16S rRNA (guanine966-N2)-methyltransferase